MMRAVVVIVCLASAAIVAVYSRYTGDTREPIYTVPSRPEPPSTPAAATAVRPIDPTDRATLARALQRELMRVGCYQGEISGVWTTSSRMAMKTFNEHVNATLPVDNPDPVLLSLVQGRRERACSAPCPAGQTPAAGGACASTPVTATSGRTAPETKSDTEWAAEALPVAGAAAAGAAAAVALAAPGTAKPDPKGPIPDAKAATPGSIRPQAGRPGDQSVPVPPEGMARDRKPRRSAEAPPARPPKVVRDVLRALGFQ
jgi:hypothetical protein